MRPSSLDVRSGRDSTVTGGMMQRKLRGTATAMVAVGLVASLRCAASGQKAKQAPDLTASSPQASSETQRAATPGGKRLTQASLNVDADGSRLVLSASAPLLYKAYDPRPNLLVVDLPNFS